MAFNKQQWILDRLRNTKFGVFKLTCHLAQEKHCRHVFNDARSHERKKNCRHFLSVTVLTAVTLLFFSPRLSCSLLFVQNLFIPDCYKWFFNECRLWREATLLSYIRMSWVLNVLCLRNWSRTKEMIYIYIYIYIYIHMYIHMCICICINYVYKRVYLFFLATKQFSITFDVRSIYGGS